MTGRRQVGGQSALDTFSTDRSRPSKTNCTTGVSAAEEPDFAPGEWWRRKNAIVDRFVEELPARAARPISVRGGTKLRDECAREKISREEYYRSRSWSEILNEFLKWYNGYRDAYLVFKDPDGEEVRGDMPNSHQPRYGDKYYARLKAFERQVIEEFDDPHSVMLTFSGSSRNANGGWRCPADHLRDVVDSWRPKRGRGVYHTLDYVLDGRRWEYAMVLEKHQSGYGHVHCAVFVDGEVEESDFHSVIDAHLRECEIAGRDAHDYYSHNEDDRPISIKRIDPNGHEVDAIQNLGSYIGEYIGAHGEPLFDRGIDELVFRAAIWATGTRMVRFSNGANEMVDRDRELVESEREKPKTKVRPNPEFDPERHASSDSDVSAFEVDNPGWSIVGVARIINDEERVFRIEHEGVVWREIDDASHLDPPKSVPPDRPKKRMNKAQLSSF